MTKYILSVIVWFFDIVNYYPNWDSPYPIYWDWSEPFFISFSLFRFIIVYYLVYCVELLIKIKNDL